MTIVTSSGGRSAACQLATLSGFDDSNHTSFFSEWNLGFFLGMVKADQE
jgi:hypothetical protein